MSVVQLHVYDVTNTTSEAANSAIKRFNAVTRDFMGIGGVFHGGIEVDHSEWSFGFCEAGSGVYLCEPKQNAAYTYRETHTLGVTRLSGPEVCCALLTPQPC